MSSLPPEIITNLLTRLPVKSLLRFRCVCKPWCAEIDSPQFIKLHLNHSITTGSNHSSIGQRTKGTLYSLDLDSQKNLVKIDIPSNNPPVSTIINTCNGLLLLGNPFESKNLILFNPSTRKHHLLPTPPVISNCLKGPIGLGYDVVNDDYKVFHLVYLFDENHNTYNIICCEARIYSLKSNLWHIKKDIAKEMICGFRFEAYVNGALHTFNDKCSTAIFALDIGKEAINLIPLPNAWDKNVSFSMAHVFDGRLAVLCLYPDERTDIWVMKEYGVKESWSMFLSMKAENLDRLVIPMVYSKSRTEVLLSYDSKKLVWYDLKKKTVRSFEVSGSYLELYRVCVESLFSVGGTAKDDKKKQRGRGEMKVEIVKKRR